MDKNDYYGGESSSLHLSQVNANKLNVHLIIYPIMDIKQFSWIRYDLFLSFIL